MEQSIVRAPADFAEFWSFKANKGALITTNTVLGVPYYV